LLSCYLGGLYVSIDRREMTVERRKMDVERGRWRGRRKKAIQVWKGGRWRRDVRLGRK
jgi:hypothetical protein